MSTITLSKYDELVEKHKGWGCKEPELAALTDLIEQAIKTKTYKLPTEIRDELGNDIVIQKHDVLVTFSFVGDPYFWVVLDPSYDGNIILLGRSSEDGTLLKTLLYEG
jgi:hypothetical protein